GTLWIAGPSMVGDFHPLISTGLPAHTVFIYSRFIKRSDQYRFQLSIRNTEEETSHLLASDIGFT
ncbi:hypothetical protein BME00_14665, partial [Klebsiella pneumoniae]